MPEHTKTISRRMFDEVWSGGNLNVIDELVAPDATGHDPANPDVPPGPEGVRRLVTMYRSAFPDLRLTVEDQIAEGDKVTTRWTARGTQQGDLPGVPATGRQGTITGISIDRIEGDKIRETWTNWDTLGLLQQLGVVAQMSQT